VDRGEEDADERGAGEEAVDDAEQTADQDVCLAGDGDDGPVAKRENKAGDEVQRAAGYPWRGRDRRSRP